MYSCSFLLLPLSPPWFLLPSVGSTTTTTLRGIRWGKREGPTIIRSRSVDKPHLLPSDRSRSDRVDEGMGERPLLSPNFPPHSCSMSNALVEEHRCRMCMRVVAHILRRVHLTRSQKPWKVSLCLIASRHGSSTVEHPPTNSQSATREKGSHARKTLQREPHTHIHLAPVLLHELGEGGETWGCGGGKKKSRWTRFGG